MWEGKRVIGMRRVIGGVPELTIVFGFGLSHFCYCFAFLRLLPTQARAFKRERELDPVSPRPYRYLMLMRTSK